MKRKVFLLFMIIFFPMLVNAHEIHLFDNLKAKAWVIKSDKDTFWEKSLIVRFPERRRVLSTNDGFIDAMAVVNYSAHPDLWRELCDKMKTKKEVGGKVYTRKIKEQIAGNLGIRSQDIAQMATAANMDNLAVVAKTYKALTVAAMVTAGARSNAVRTGIDEGRHIEGEEPKGTVNILILTNARFTDGAMARAVITATEAKMAAFEDLRVPSSYTKNIQATGTGTDSIIIVSGTSWSLVTYTGGHGKMCELIGKAVYEAVMEALIKQNGFKKAKAD